jgi:dTDP-4-amino-4,6-dideoxygalactose transaminase
MIRFSSPAPVGNELKYITEAIEARGLAGVGTFAKRCETWLEAQTKAPRALLISSCTSGLELAALLLDVKPGDEVIMPSFTFCSTASAFALRGAKIVFADIDPDTLCMHAEQVEPLITPRTKVVVAVHYAGFGGGIVELAALCASRGVHLVEDAAQALLSFHDGKPLGTFGCFSALSFHDTKNVTGGEGGALIVNDAKLVEQAEIVRDKGTNRAQFFRGQVDKYTWQALGSSFVPSELCTAYLLAQLEKAEEITVRRKAIAQRYAAGLGEATRKSGGKVPSAAHLDACNGHIFWMLLRDAEQQRGFMQHLKTLGVAAVHHYVPLHSAPAGLQYGVTPRPLTVTDDIWCRLVRLPLHMDLSDADVDKVIESSLEFLRT